MLRQPLPHRPKGCPACTAYNIEELAVFYIRMALIIDTIITMVAWAIYQAQLVLASYSS